MISLPVDGEEVELSVFKTIPPLVEVEEDAWAFPSAMTSLLIELRGVLPQEEMRVAVRMQIVVIEREMITFFS